MESTVGHNNFENGRTPDENNSEKISEQGGGVYHGASPFVGDNAVDLRILFPSHDTVATSKNIQVSTNRNYIFN